MIPIVTSPSSNPNVKLDGPELWEILFGILEGDVPEEFTDEKLQQIADAINQVFLGNSLLMALVQIIDRSNNIEVGSSKVVDMRKIAERALANPLVFEQKSVVDERKRCMDIAQKWASDLRNNSTARITAAKIATEIQNG